MSSVFQKIVQGGAKAAEVAAPIVGTVIGGAVGGPAGAAAGAAAGKGLAKGVQKIASNRHLGGSGGGFTPSSAGSITEARTQDKARMQDQYGLGNNGG